MPDYDLDTAYEITGPTEARAAYDDWSATYDEEFAEAWGYVAPREIAGIFRELAGPDHAPILDIGAGTGLVAGHLPDAVIDGIDISARMLAKAGEKGLYRARIEADLKQTLPMETAGYGGFISCGCFTHGHVGPEVFPELFRVARSGALFVLGTIPPVYDGTGIGSALALHHAAGRIGPLRFREIPIYEGAEHPHKDDCGLVMIFEAT
jgi:SAM-dependent methyltransferase